jgi:hypothetical protein
VKNFQEDWALFGVYLWPFFKLIAGYAEDLDSLSVRGKAFLFFYLKIAVYKIQLVGRVPLRMVVCSFVSKSRPKRFMPKFEIYY